VAFLSHAGMIACGVGLRVSDCPAQGNTSAAVLFRPMTATRYPVTNVIIETPRYAGVGGSVAGGASGEHDILGHGHVAIDDNAIHPRGIASVLEPKEKRTYPLADITVWHAAGASITFGVGHLGLFATDGAEAPVHNCEMKCEDANAAQQLTAEARAAGLKTGGGQSFHSGI
jgi:hypothetical protein